MAVHSNGTGTGWEEAAPDIDQPLGLSWRELQDLRKGVRKRINKEHKAFGDVTVGGEHLPAGCRILGIVDSTADMTKGAGDASYDVTDGKFIGRGLIYDQTNNVFWCWTNSDGTTSANPYQILQHPDRAWAGGDVTWTGGHEFDASVDITGNVAIDGDLTVDGNLVVDGTAIAFGGTAGIGLFYDPTAYTGGESVTLPNGLILKQGVKAYSASSTLTVTFGSAFPTAVLSEQVSLAHSSAGTIGPVISNVTTAALEIKTTSGAGTNVHWLVIGR